jgi:hypothetical protein
MEKGAEGVVTSSLENGRVYRFLQSTDQIFHNVIN